MGLVFTSLGGRPGAAHAPLRFERLGGGRREERLARTSNATATM